MGQDSESVDRFITIKEVLSIIEPYHNAVATLGSCMLNASLALRASDSSDIRSEGDAIFEKLDLMISELEKANDILQSLAVTGGAADE